MSTRFKDLVELKDISLEINSEDEFLVTQEEYDLYKSFLPRETLRPDGIIFYRGRPFTVVTEV